MVTGKACECASSMDYPLAYVHLRMNVMFCMNEVAPSFFNSDDCEFTRLISSILDCQKYLNSLRCSCNSEPMVNIFLY